MGNAERETRRPSNESTGIATEKATRTCLLSAMVPVARLDLLEDDVGQSLHIVRELGLDVDSEDVLCATRSNKCSSLLYVTREDLNDILEALRIRQGHLIPAADEVFLFSYRCLVQIARILLVERVEHIDTVVAVSHHGLHHKEICDAIVARCVSKLEQRLQLLRIHVVLLSPKRPVEPFPVDVERAVAIRLIMCADDILTDHSVAIFDSSWHLDLRYLIILNELGGLGVLVCCVDEGERHSRFDAQKLQFLHYVHHEERVDFVARDDERLVISALKIDDAVTITVKTCYLFRVCTRYFAWQLTLTEDVVCAAVEV